jgi:hypothetical protein
MWPFKPNETAYLAVESSDTGSEVGHKKEQKTRRKNIASWTQLLTLCVVGALCLFIGFAFGELIKSNVFLARLRATSTKYSKCSNPTTRKEWRSLSELEKGDYITAVKCMTVTQSKLSEVKGDTLYNDFPYLHTTVGGYGRYREEDPIIYYCLLIMCVQAHLSAAFLAWHRLLLHNYEAELKTTCGYSGSLT